MDGWSATRAKETRSNRLERKDSRSQLLEISDGGSQNSFRIVKEHKKEVISYSSCHRISRAFLLNELK